MVKTVVALIAHDEKKEDLLRLVRAHRSTFARFTLLATGTTGRLIEDDVGLPVRRMLSGPQGGDLQIGARIVEGIVDALIFLRDPLTAHPPRARHPGPPEGLRRASGAGRHQRGIGGAAPPHAGRARGTGRRGPDRGLRGRLVTREEPVADCPDCRSAGAVVRGWCQVCGVAAREPARSPAGGPAVAPDVMRDVEGDLEPSPVRFADVMREPSLASVLAAGEGEAGERVIAACGRLQTLLASLRAQFLTDVVGLPPIAATSNGTRVPDPGEVRAPVALDV